MSQARGIQAIWKRSKSKVALDLKAAFERGRKDRRLHKSLNACPYAALEKAKAWEQGWITEFEVARKS